MNGAAHPRAFKQEGARSIHGSSRNNATMLF